MSKIQLNIQRIIQMEKSKNRSMTLQQQKMMDDRNYKYYNGMRNSNKK